MSNLATIVNNILADSGIDDINVVVTTGSYSNPAWITALSWSKISSTPTTLSGYGITDAVPAIRTITINGVTQDLSANRTWTITAGVSSVSAGTGISVNQTTGAVTVTNTGTLTVAGTANQVLVNGGTAAANGNITLSLPQSIATTSSPTFNRISTGGLYGTSGSGNIPIWQYDSNNPGYGIMFYESSPDYLKIDVSGNLVTGTPDFQVSPDTAYVNGNIVLHAGNYNSYAPTLTGGGASGTWGINITGSSSYASSAGNADTVDGYHATNAASGLAYYASNGYLNVPSWINVGTTGIFSGTNNAHIRPNQSGSYGSWEMIGSRNGWSGIWFNDSGNTLMMNSAESGHYMNGYGWQFRWYVGTLYVTRSTYGGGTEYTVLDSGNYNSYAPTLTGGGASGTWGINVTGTAGSTQTLALIGLGSGSVNVNNPNTAVYRTETGSGAVLAYAPVLHVGGGDTMWQMQGSYGTSGNGALYFRQGYNGSWGNWLTMLSSANYGSYALPLSGGTLTGPVSLNNSSYFVGSSSYGFRFNNAADTANNMTLTNANGDLYVRGQVYVGGNGSNTGTQLVYNSGTWGINITGSAQLLDDVNNYTWSSSTTPTSYSLGMQLSFVGPNAGEGSWQNYGTVINARTYSGGGGSLQIYVPYGPNNGGPALQVRFGDYSAPTYGNQWTAWKTLLQSDNYNSYAPTLTGGGASGTWGINVTGTAGSETLATVTSRGNTTTTSMAVGYGSIPNGRLYVNSSSSLDALAIQSTTNGVALVFADNVTPTWANAPRIVGYNNDLYIRTLAADRIRVTSAGDTYLYKDLYLGSTGTRITADAAVGYVRIYGSASNYLAIGPYNNNGWTYMENIGNSSGTYYYVQSGRHAFDGGDVTPYSDSVRSLGTSSYKWNEVHAAGWFRSWGNTGWYNETYAGGWRMTDSSYIRAYNGKALSMEGASVDYVSSIYMNGGVYIQTNNTRNLLVKSTGSSDCGILGRGNGDQFAFQIYGSGGDYGFLDGAWAAWDIRKTVNGAMYMNDNNSYYLQTDSSSYLYRVLSKGFGDNANARIFSPGDGYSVNNGPQSGAIKIALPAAGSFTNTMISFTVKIYNYSTGTSRTICVGGYTYYDTNWYNVFAYQSGDQGAGDLNVRFGIEGGRNCVWIGETNTSWSYPNIFVTDVQSGHSQPSALLDGWTVSIVTSFGTVQTSRTAHQQINTGNYNSYSPTLTGGGASGTWGINVTGYSQLLYFSGSSSKAFQDNLWAGGGSYPGYQYTGGNSRFGFSSTSGVVDVYADGNFYATDNSYLVLHAGNYSSYAMPVSGGTMSGYLIISANWGASPYTSALTIIGTYPSITFRGSNSNWEHLQHVDSSGNFNFYGGAGYTANNWNQFGQITTSGTISWLYSITATAFYESSDERIKTIIEDNSRVNDIHLIKPKLYKKDGKTEFGYIAQELLKIMPYSVEQGNNGYYNLAYREVHTAKIAYLEDSIDEIKAKILYLEQQLKNKTNENN